MGTGIALEQGRLYAVAIAFMGSAGSHERVRSSILAARPSAVENTGGAIFSHKGCAPQKNQTELPAPEKNHTDLLTERPHAYMRLAYFTSVFGAPARCTHAPMTTHPCMSTPSVESPGQVRLRARAAPHHHGPKAVPRERRPEVPPRYRQGTAKWHRQGDCPRHLRRRSSSPG